MFRILMLCVLALTFCASPVDARCCGGKHRPVRKLLGKKPIRTIIKHIIRR